METVASEKEIDQVVKSFLKQYSHGVFSLSGPLGAGKTTLVRHIIEDIAAQSGVKIARVMSPTFTIHQFYDQLKPTVDHFDLYRFEDADEAALMEIGYYEAVERAENQTGFVFVEWPEKAVDLNALALSAQIIIEACGEGRRRYHFKREG